MNPITDRIRRVKASPFYQEWHYEIGMLILVAALILIGAVAVETAWNRAELGRHNQELRRQARQGAAAHQAECARRATLLRTIGNQREFLDLTLAERIAKYGELGKTPDTTVRASIANERVELRSYRALRC